MRAYSVDLRQRVLAALERGMARHEVVTTFQVSLATLKRWLRLQRAAEDLTPKAPTGRQRTIASGHETALWAQLEAHADATLAEHTRLWNAAQGMAVSERTVSRAITRLGWTRKKRQWVPPSAMSSSGRHTESA
jgi:transposase